MERVKFDPSPLRLGLVLNMICGVAEVYQGDIVAFEGSPSDTIVSVCDGATTGAPIGVALNSATVGESIAVASTGSIVKVRAGAPFKAAVTLQVDDKNLGAAIASTGEASGYVLGHSVERNDGSSPSYAYIYGPHYLQASTKSSAKPSDSKSWL